VGEVQTKRTIRRQSSTASNASSRTGSVGGPAGKGLQRQNSSGSMTERTFRDPSPSRGLGRTPTPEAPPVPTIPRHGPPQQPEQQIQPHMRLASMEAPERIYSPPPRARVQGQGLDQGGAPPTRNSAGRRTKNLSVVDNADTRGSVNFSYPM